MKRIVEIRSYNLKPGTGADFHELFIHQSLPLLRRWQVDVVDFGRSLHDPDAYYLVRAFNSLDEREQSEEAFYGSEEWRKGPRDAVLALIDSYTTVVIEMNEAALQGLRREEARRTNPGGETPQSS